MIKKCPGCEKPEFDRGKMINSGRGYQGPAEYVSDHSENNFFSSKFNYPIQAVLCMNCGLIQLVGKGDFNELKIKNEEM